MRTPTANGGGQARRTAPRISSTSRARFASEPPYPSRRWLRPGESQMPRRCGCAAWISTPSIPAACAMRAEVTYPSTSAAMSAASISLHISPWACGSPVASELGPQAGSQLSGPLCDFSGPFWLSCTNTFVPCSWHAAAMRAKPAPAASLYAAGRSGPDCGWTWVWPTTIRPKPPAARVAW